MNQWNLRYQSLAFLYLFVAMEPFRAYPVTLKIPACSLLRPPPPDRIGWLHEELGTVDEEDLDEIGALPPAKGRVFFFLFFGWVTCFFLFFWKVVFDASLVL